MVNFLFFFIKIIVNEGRKHESVERMTSASLLYRRWVERPPSAIPTHTVEVQLKEANFWLLLDETSLKVWNQFLLQWGEERRQNIFFLIIFTINIQTTRPDSSFDFFISNFFRQNFFNLEVNNDVPFPNKIVKNAIKSVFLVELVTNEVCRRFFHQ